MLRTLVMVMALGIASPAFGQVDFGAPLKLGPRADTSPSTQDTFKSKKPPAQDTFKGSSSDDANRQHIGNGWFLNDSSDKRVCYVQKLWNIHPTIKRVVGAEQIALVIEYDAGKYYFRIKGSGPGWNLTEGQFYSYVFKFDFPNGSWTKFEGTTANGMMAMSSSILSIGSDNKSFREHFAGATDVWISIEGVSLGGYGLKGSRNAMNRFYQCVEAARYE